VTLKVAHVITGLDTGGAETSLYRLLYGLRSRDVQSTLYSLGGPGVYGSRIAALGVKVRCLGMRPAAPNPMKILQLASWLRGDRANVVQTWMYHADLVGGIAARLADDIPVVWCVRHGDPASTKTRTMLIAWSCALFSSWLPTSIVCCSNASISSHAALGYSAKKMKLISNGVDQQIFTNDGDARTRLRGELGFAARVPLSGMVARYHKVKNFFGFARSAEMVARRHPDARFLLCGAGLDHSNHELMHLLGEHGVADRCILLGERGDIPVVMAALDVLVSPSVSEGFPNVVAEAMSCGVPCVVTDVGDSALIVGDTGMVVAPNDDEALADAWIRLLSETPEQRGRRGRQARERIGAEFSIASMVDKYEALFQEVAADANVLH
jgi:glycosyltransferase involved in cell wall biosynthesis